MLTDHQPQDQQEQTGVAMRCDQASKGRHVKTSQFTNQWGKPFGKLPGNMDRGNHPGTDEIAAKAHGLTPILGLYLII
jgi:hypothetical protein